MIKYNMDLEQEFNTILAECYTRNNKNCMINYHDKNEMLALGGEIRRDHARLCLNGNVESVTLIALIE